MASLSDDLAQHELSPLWDVMKNLVTEHPTPQARPHAWRYPMIREFLIRSGDEISAEDAERRVLILENPGMARSHAITDSLYAGIQLVLPGEIAPVHRHSQSALRFVLESDGAWTSVDGEKIEMRPFDLVLTPHWRWHEHGGGKGPAIWLDGLDIPIVQRFAAAFAEREGNAPTLNEIPAGTSFAAYGSNLRPVTVLYSDTNTPLFHYPYSQWRKSLENVSIATDVDRHLGWMMEFVNPVDSGSVMKTISAFCHKFPSGFHTTARRQSAGSVFTIVEGTGTFLIDDQSFTVAPKDVVAVPSWARLEIAASNEDLILFSYSDRTCHEKLGFWREERY